MTKTTARTDAPVREALLKDEPSQQSLTDQVATLTAEVARLQGLIDQQQSSPTEEVARLRSLLRFHTGKEDFDLPPAA